MDEIEHYIDRLMSANDDGAFLIISVAGAVDFLQLTGDARGAQIDFPLITDRQRSLEQRIRLAAERVGLPVVENRGGGSDRFLDINVEGTAAEVARVCRALLYDVFGASEGAELEFEGDGLA
jgi:hypothetical protein